MSIICCRKCDEPRCDGCNIYILKRALDAGELRDFMSDGYTINRRLFLPRGVAKAPVYIKIFKRKNKRKE